MPLRDGYHLSCLWNDWCFFWQNDTCYVFIQNNWVVKKFILVWVHMAGPESKRRHLFIYLFIYFKIINVWGELTRNVTLVLGVQHRDSTSLCTSCYTHHKCSCRLSSHNTITLPLCTDCIPCSVPSIPLTSSFRNWKPVSPAPLPPKWGLLNVLVSSWFKNLIFSHQGR